MRKTAVDYLFEKLWGIHKDKFTWQMILKEAKKKEKKQIENIFDDGYAMKDIDGEQYYKQTYEENES